MLRTLISFRQDSGNNEPRDTFFRPSCAVQSRETVVSVESHFPMAVRRTEHLMLRAGEAADGCRDERRLRCFTFTLSFPHTSKSQDHQNLNPQGIR